MAKARSGSSTVLTEDKDAASWVRVGELHGLRAHRMGKHTWSTLKGYERFLDALQRVHCVQSKGTDSWWWWRDHQPGNLSRVPIVCTRCHLELTPTLKEFIRAKRVACFCTGKVKWASRAGYDRIVAIVNASRFVARGQLCDFAQWRAWKPTAFSELQLTCSKCNVDVQCKLYTFVQNKGRARCDCNSFWCTEPGRQRLLNAVAETRFEPIDWMTSAEAWAEHGVHAYSYIAIRCRECHVSPPRTQLNRFMNLRSADCSCKYKTELKVLQQCENMAEPLGVAVQRQFYLPGCKSSKGWNMPFDIAIVRSGVPLLLIEIDGDQHFGTGRAPWASPEVVRNDVQKESFAAAANVPLVRMYQPSIWNDEFEWRAHVAIKMKESADGVLSAGVYCQPECEVYREGVYAEARKG